MKHKQKSKTFLKIKSLFLRIAKNDETFQKRRVFLVQEAEKTKNWRCKKRPKKFSKKEIKNSYTQKEGKMEQEKKCVFFSKKNKLKKGKEKGR